MNYLLGINQSIYISISIGIVSILYYLIAKPWEKNSSNLPINDSVYYAIITLFIFFISTASFCLIYTLTNLFLNINIYLNDFRETLQLELQNGVLTMRLTSILLGYVVFTFFLRIIKMTPFPNEKTENNYNNYTEHTVEGVSVNKLFRNKFDHYFLNLTQCSFYALILTVLWLLQFKGNHSVYFVLLSYFLFVIIDDWLIVFDNSLTLKGHIKQKYNLKITIFNVILFGVGALAISTNIIFQVIFISFSIYLLTIHYLNYYGKLFQRIIYKY